MDKNKIIQAATKFVQKGQFDKAIREYQRIIEDDPKDIRILLKVGELYQKRGDNREAAATLLKVADSYASDGFFLKAAAVYKQVLKLNPSLLDVNVRLAELYQQLGLMSDAMQQFQLVAASYEKQGNAQAVLAILKKLVELEPDNAASRVRLAEAYSAENMTGEAIAELTRVAAQLKLNSRTEEYTKVAERLIFLDPSNIALTRELASAYLARGDPKRALTKLQICFKEDARNVDTLILLAQAFLDLGQKVKTVSVYKELAKIYADAGRNSEEEATWRRVLSLLPEDPDAKAALKAGSDTSQDADAMEEVPERKEPTAAAPAETPVARARSPAPRRPQEPGIQRLLTETDVYLKYGLHEKAAEHLKKILASAPQSVAAHEKAKDLYLAMGDTRRAADELASCASLAAAAGNLSVGKVYLDQLLELAPDHARVDDLSRLLGNVATVPEVAEDAVIVDSPEPTAPGGKSYDAVDAFVRAAAGDEDELVMDEPGLADDDAILINTATGEVRVIATLDDDAVVVPGAGEDSLFSDDAQLVDDGSYEPPDMPQEDDDLALTAAAQALEGSLIGEPLTRRPPTRSVTSPGAVIVPPPSAAPAVIESAARARAVTSPGGEDKPAFKPRVPPPELLRVPTPPPATARPTRPTPVPRVDPPPAASPRPTFARSSTGPNGVVAPRRVNTPEPPPVLPRVEKPAAESPARRAASKPRDDIAAEFAEAEFFIEQGLFDEAKEAIEALRKRAQAKPELAARVEALTRRMAPPKAADSGLIDLGTELAAEVSAAQVGAPEEFQYSVQDVLKEFKKGVEKSVRSEDVETHYELGIAYKEMGLTEEAIGEFEVALRGATGKPKEPDCLAMVGLCLSAKGDFDKAVTYFERALATRAIRPESALNLHYEIGAAKEASGDPAGAVEAYERVAKTDPAYRNVGTALSRVRAARAAQGGPSGRQPSPADRLGDADRKAPGADSGAGKARKVGYL